MDVLSARAASSRCETCGRCSVKLHSYGKMLLSGWNFTNITVNDLLSLTFVVYIRNTGYIVGGFFSESVLFSFESCNFYCNRAGANILFWGFSQHQSNFLTYCNIRGSCGGDK